MSQENIETEKPKLAWGGAGSLLSNSAENCPRSFKDVMSEDLAKSFNLRDEELENLSAEDMPCSSGYCETFDCNDPINTSNDEVIAKLMQEQYNKDYNGFIQREEKHFNKNSKVSLSLNKYKICSSSNEDLPEIDEENRDLDSFEKRGRDDPVIPACGYIRHNNEFITKHDRTISGRRNAERIMNFPPGINTGDGGGFDMEISNKVYNNLHETARSDGNRKYRHKDKSDKAITDKAMDRNTKLIVYKLVNNSVLDSVNGVISTGKEAVVFHAKGGACEEEEFPDECAIKVFKTTLTDFKTREKYIKNDYRFKNRMSKNNNKTTINMWAEKEFHNLKRLEKASIACPQPLIIKENVLVMSFIGADQVPATKLKEVQLSFAEWCICHEQVVELMGKMFAECHLVHGDLSEYNLLWHEDQVWVIDVSQAVEPTHPRALKFLLRDCHNVVNFFRKKKVPEVGTALELFEKITAIQLQVNGDNVENAVEEYELNQELWKDGLKANCDRFETLWREIQRDESGSVRDLISDEEVLEKDEDLVVKPSVETVGKSKKKKKQRPKRKSKPPLEGDLESRLLISVAQS